MQRLPQIVTAFTPSMTIENTEVEDLRITALSVRRGSLSISAALVLVCLLLPLPLPKSLQRTAGWRSSDIDRWWLCESRNVDYTSLIAVFIIGAGAARDRHAEVVLCAP